MKARSPLDGKFYYFFDKCLAFGASISCAIFQRFSNCINHLVKFRTKKPLINYLDDYLFAQLYKLLCNQQVKVFLKVCEEINFPVSMEKTFWATTILTFLGLLLDTYNQTVSVPKEKIDKAIKLITTVLEKRSKKLTLAQLQKICGFLNFIGRAIVPGRAFTRRLYFYTSSKTVLKPHHHIRINREMRRDLETWLEFLHHPSVFCRPFMDFTGVITASEVKMFSDASTNPNLGFSAICG